jgi:hypothetical protein
MERGLPCPTHHTHTNTDDVGLFSILSAFIPNVVRFEGEGHASNKEAAGVR